MNDYLKDKLKAHTLLSVLSAAIIFVIIYALIAPLNVRYDSAHLNQLSNEIRPEHQFFSGGNAHYKSEIISYSVSDKALLLTYPENIDNITLSYKEYGEWVEITEENSGKLSADTSYQLKVEYDHITADQLLEADCQMVYGLLPDWFSPNESGVLLYGDEIVAEIEAQDGRVVITFYENWLKKQGNNILHGSFKINGEIQWEKLPSDGGKAPALPGLGVDLTFEEDLASKYGSVTVEKNEPELVKHGDSYYLRYEINVTSYESDITVPDVYVKDTFMSNTGYIEGYVGVTDSLTEPLEFYPQENSTVDISGSLHIEMIGSSMRWDIGELSPGEIRTLTYYAKVKASYINSILNSQFKNTAEVFSGDIPKNTDTSTYAPKNAVEIKKTLTETDIDRIGTGTLKYRITLSAPDTNSYTLENLILSDSFPEYLSDFLTIRSITVDGKEVSAGGSSFSINNISLAPGETVTVEYTVDAEYIFASGNGDIELTNIARVSSGDGRTLKSSSNNKTFRQNSWLRKIYGEPLKSAKTIEIPEKDSIFDTDKKTVANNGGVSFIAPKNSLRYQVVLNEDGRWNLSSASLKDAFVDEYMSYCGYMQISVYEKPAVTSDKLIDDGELLELLENDAPSKTVWLNVDSLDSFEFTPGELGLPDGEFTYLLTYYAFPQGVDNVGSFVAANEFEISGRVGFGNGKFRAIPGMKKTVNSVMQGGIAYDAEKIGWYYETSPVYRTVEDYSDFVLDNDYKNGALYWIIRLDGDIREGHAANYGQKNAGLTGFIIRDNPDGSQFKRDSLVGVYVGSDSFDFLQYDSYEEFILKEVETENAAFKKLNGNLQNDKWFHSASAYTDPDYEWFAENTYIDGIIFPHGYDLADDEALYIVLRTVPNSAPASTATFTNALSVKDDSQSDFVPMDNASLIVTHAIFKESKGAYTYDADTDEYTNCSPSYSGNGDDWKPSSLDWTYIRNNCGSGIYAPWLLNVNYNGTMSGTAEVSDILPEGMELAYCDINWIGSFARNPLPVFEEIQELENDGDWVRYDKISNIADNVKFGKAITYYNTATRELRWKISNLTKWDNPPGAVGHDVNIRVVCKLTDHDLLLRRGEKTYVNYAYSGDEVGTASVIIRKDGSMNKQIVSDELEDGNSDFIKNPLKNRLPFSIEINPLGEDLCDGDTLPALIDELSNGLVFVEESLSIKDKNGSPIKGYSFTIEERADGGQTLIITGLPDNTRLTVFYDVRINAEPGKRVDDIGNNAYWMGYPSDSPQIANKSFSYSIGGNIFSSGQITVTITKIDAADHSRKLQGAKFTIYEVGADGALSDTAIASGATDSNGMLVFDKNSKLLCNRVYCIIETAAPNGYKLDPEPHYFAVVSDTDRYTPSEKIADLVDIWYESPDYTYTMTNEKGDISVKKIFINSDGDEIFPTSGSYSFGLFETRNAKKPLEILTIVYTDDKPEYYLDGVETSRPYFSKFDPELMYFVYELDSDGNPIHDADTAKLNGVSFLVEYYDKNDEPNNQAAVGGEITVKNTVVNEPAELPSAGGKGLESYYFTGGILLLISLLYYAFDKYFNRSDIRN